MLQLDSNEPTKIAAALASGAVLAVPTETVWGFTAGLNSEKAIKKLIRIKDRDVYSGKIFTLVPDSPAHIADFAVLSPEVAALIKHHFPGPLTLILPKNPTFHHPYYDHFDTIGLRIPDTPLFRALLPATGPLLLTSANRRGQPAVSTAGQISDNFPELDGIIRGKSGGELPSTVLDFTGKSPVVLRQGGLKVI